MQKLQIKLKNTPRNTSLVPCSVSSDLNRVKKLSDQNKVLTCNNSEENHQQHRAGSNLRVLNVVYVLNKKKEPLMPTNQSKARRLLRGKKAKVVKRFPFTIQLLEGTGEVKQEVVVGVDVGYQNVGLSAISKKKELFASEVSLRTDVVKLLSERRMYRSGRRNKLWYRKPRFNNRSKSSSWLAPSVKGRLDSHIRLVNKISKLLPITKIIVETAKFDIQKINNPEISGSDYQNGVQKDFENVRAYVLFRDNHSCQYCKKTNIKLIVHHLESRQTGGNRPDNLITLCEKCHGLFHKGKIKLDVKKKIGFKANTWMSIIRKRIMEELKKTFVVEETFGYITKNNRIERKMEKTHVNDAFIIANGNEQKRQNSYLIEQKRKNNRCLQLNRKGSKPSIRRKRSVIQPRDLVKVCKKIYEVVGSHSYGKQIIIKNDKEKLDINVKKVTWHYKENGFKYINILRIII